MGTAVLVPRNSHLNCDFLCALLILLLCVTQNVLNEARYTQMESLSPGPCGARRRGTLGWGRFVLTGVWVTERPLRVLSFMSTFVICKLYSKR